MLVYRVDILLAFLMLNFNGPFLIKFAHLRILECFFGPFRLLSKNLVQFHSFLLPLELAS